MKSRDDVLVDTISNNYRKAVTKKFSIMKKNFTVAAIFFCSRLLAQTDSALTDFKPMDRVVITANKVLKKQSTTGKVVTVIDKKMLENFGGRTIGEILNTVSGTTIIGANNPLGSNQRISIRGASDGNVLLLIDGIPANDPSVISNYFDLNFINTAQIARIEILKGGQSTLYGSDAVSGVINIITKKQENKFSPYGSLQYGSYSTVNGNMGVKGVADKFFYNAFASGISSKGFSSAFDSTGRKNYDRDGYHQYNLRGDAGISFTKNISWNSFLQYSRYSADIDGAAYRDDKDFSIRNKNWQAGTTLNWKLSNGQLNFFYNYNKTDRLYTDDSLDRSSFAYYSTNTYTGRTHFAEIFKTTKWKEFELLTGVDFRFYNTDQYYFSKSSFGPFETSLDDSLAKMSQWSGYASAVYSKKDWNIEFGGRLNHHSEYGNNFTYTFNPSFLINNRVKLFANISSAFKAPSLYQLFDPYIGNTKLDPENSTVFEAGVEFFSTHNWKLRVNNFYRKTNNAIQFIITNPAFFTSQYRNIANQKAYGAEAEMQYENEKWNLAANYTFTKGNAQSAYSESGMQLSKDTTFNNLYRVPEHAANIFVTYKINPKLSVSSMIKMVGKRLEPVYASSPVELKSYTTFDLSGAYYFNKKVRCFVDLKNITNTEYFDLAGYNSRKFNFTLGVGYNL